MPRGQASRCSTTFGVGVYFYCTGSRECVMQPAPKCNSEVGMHVACVRRACVEHARGGSLFAGCSPPPHPRPWVGQLSSHVSSQRGEHSSMRVAGARSPLADMRQAEKPAVGKLSREFADDTVYHPPPHQPPQPSLLSLCSRCCSLYSSSFLPRFTANSFSRAFRCFGDPLRYQVTKLGVF